MASAEECSSGRGGRDTYFFVHVMKTAGMTFLRHMRANFAPEEIYPGSDDHTGVEYWVIERLRQAVQQRGDQIPVWSGHFPYFVTSMVPGAQSDERRSQRSPDPAVPGRRATRSSEARNTSKGRGPT